MKKIMFLIVALMALVCVPIMAQGFEIPAGLGFETFSALVALTAFVIPFIVEIFKWAIPNMASLVKQIISWLIGVLIAFLGWKFNQGILSEISWWLALLYGLGAGLVANGVFDTGIVTGILGLFGAKKE